MKAALKVCKSLAAQTERDNIIKSLDLVPHPEGGYFREVYRALAPVMERKGLTDERGKTIPTPTLPGKQRNTMTSIHWLATADKPRLLWGLNKSDHVHYYEGGDAFSYILVAPDGTIEQHVWNNFF